MERRLNAAALLLPLVLAAPSMAQLPGDDRSDISNTLLGPSYAPTGNAAAALPSLAGRSGINLTRRDFADEVGPRTFSNKLIGAWPVADDVHVGVGLMSVSRYSSKEPDFKRAPLNDVGGRRQRIAAIGFSFSF